MAKLHEELENLDIFVDKNTPRDELITVLKTNLCLKTLDNLENNNTSMKNVVTKNIDLMDIDKAPNIILFSLPLEVLKRFFMLGQADSSDRYTTSDMHNGLLELVKCGEINEEDVPTQNTIENWINRYSQELKKEAAECILNIFAQAT
ncbi:2902_t:CDS:2, partial [Dentiscutata erythropus]